ncbi:hypothetical protein TanjilG_14083 [Lupinus angustifolius]|uniref:RNase H type-1 domain-containing protein n=1 Tax=Lupinus angustifolius TaxID=3871 RepID=A0A1J7GC64_LUPAN|nr:hypothetical protein TanjilG_14083 [Lupinus angustifolius]
MINKSCDNFHPYASLIKLIQNWLERDWIVGCSHIHREANKWRTLWQNMAHSIQLGTHEMNTPPPNCRDLLFFDSKVIFLPRNVLVQFFFWIFPLQSTKKKYRCVKIKTVNERNSLKQTTSLVGARYLLNTNNVTRKDNKD